MAKVRCDMSVSLDGFICGPRAQDPHTSTRAASG
jgi:hypothetical protein